jgi:LPXTG-site transpeptidase (sortase) family protein
MSKLPISKQTAAFYYWLIAGSTLLITGLALLGFFWLNTYLSQRSNVKPVPASQVFRNNGSLNDGKPVISGTPVHIYIPSVSIDLNVIPGHYYPQYNSWTLTNSNAQWGDMTAPANDHSGDTFIYAHALNGVFGSLPKVKPGDQAVVRTDNGHTFTYQFSASTVTSPTDTGLFKYQGKPILILQTCTGSWYQNRQLFVFNLSKVS